MTTSGEARGDVGSVVDAILAAPLPKLERLAIADEPQPMICNKGLGSNELNSQMAIRGIKFSLHYCDPFWLKK
jgi:hypothetical protein